MTDRDDLFDMATNAIERAIQLGRDEMAHVLADWLAEQRADDPDGRDEQHGHYLDGVEDALCTLVQAGATDPRDTDEQDEGVRS